LDLEADSFDYAVSEHFVEHLPTDDLMAHLGEVRRVLRTGGHYLIVTPSRLWNGRRSVGFHLHVYTLEELCRIVGSAGLKATWVEPRFLRRFGTLLEADGFWLRMAFLWERMLDQVRIWRWPYGVRGRVIPSVIVEATKAD
jgi:SAM-dependent methyltransferase